MKLSILIPSFNDKRILNFLRSLVRISNDNFEIVVQDSCSDVDLIDEIKEIFVSTRHRLVVEKDSGIFDGINKGIKNCHGEFIITLGSDDFITNENLIKLIQNLSQHDIYFIPVRMVTPDTKKLIRYWPVRKFNRFRVAMGAQYPHFGMVCKKIVYEQYGYFNEKNKINADYEFFFELSKRLEDLSIGYLYDISTIMSLGGTSTKSFKSIISHQKIIFKFLMKKNVFLIIPFFVFKPFYKLTELILARFY
jgi:glycosyltransferase involved in cell wall biosynthesis